LHAIEISLFWSHRIIAENALTCYSYNILGKGQFPANYS